MLSSTAGLLAAAALALTGVPAAPGGRTILVPLCHGGAIPLNLPDDGRGGPGKQCPAGCHAACMGRRRDGAAE